MSVNVVLDPRSPAVRLGYGSELLLSADPVFGLSELAGVQGGPGLLMALEAPALVERVLRSSRVEIRTGVGAVVLVRGPLGMRDDNWLTEAVSELIRVAPTTGLARQILEAALAWLLDAPVAVARRTSRESVATVPAHCEIGFLEFESDRWVIVVPQRGAQAHAELCQQPLVTAFADRVRDADAASSGGTLARIPELVTSAARGDACMFLRVASDVLAGPIRLLDRHGVRVAGSDDPVRPRGRHDGWGPTMRDIVLTGEDGICGSLSVPETPALTPQMIELLEQLGSCLVCAEGVQDELRTLESLILVLGCLAPEQFAQICDELHLTTGESRRLVFIAAEHRFTGHEAHRLLGRVMRRSREQLLLTGLRLVLSDGGLLGVYPDGGAELHTHEAAWASVVRDVSREAGIQLHVAVGGPSGSAEEAHEQHAAILQLARVQASGSRYFALPPVLLVDSAGPLADVLLRVPGRQCAPFVERVLGGLLDDQRFGGELLETLHAYLQTDGSPNKAGDLLHLHPSTVKYRMRVIRELLGDRLCDQNERFDLELAVRLCLASRQIGDRSAA